MSSPLYYALLWYHAAGFIATELVSQLLAKGYEVRGTVRDPNNQAKVAHLVQLGQVRKLQVHVLANACACASMACVLTTATHCQLSQADIW